MDKNNPQKHIDTSWNKVASWYDELLNNDNDSYQSKVIAPNLLRILDLKNKEVVYDLACGQGYFSNLFYNAGAEVIGSDLSKKTKQNTIDKKWIELIQLKSKKISDETAPEKILTNLKGSTNAYSNRKSLFDYLSK